MFLALTMGVVVSCVTVASSADDPRTVALATPGPTSTPPVAATPEVTQPPTPSVTPPPTPSVTLAPPPTPAPIQAAASSIRPADGASLEPTAAGLAPSSTLPASAAPGGSPLPSASVAAATATPLSRPASRDGLDRKTRRKLDRILRNTVKNKGVAGLQAAVRLPSGETWLGTAGNAEYAPARAIGDETPFSIASVTKTFIAALILKHAEEGSIDLDAPFGRYFSDAPRSKRVTVRQLLSHTSGIYNYFENPKYWNTSRAWLRSAPTGQNSRERRWSYDEIMGLVKAGYCKPGTCYHYSNTNYVILGQVAEAVGGAPLHQQLRKRFFKPLGMKDTVYQPEERPGPDAAHGHWRNLDGSYNDHTRGSRVQPFMAAVTAADAAGAIASTARDLSIWADALYGGDVLSPRSRRAMTTFLRAGTYGLGTDVAVFSGNRGVGHRGGLRGFESSMWHFPDDGVSVVLLSNQGNWFTDVPMNKLVKVVLGKG